MGLQSGTRLWSQHNVLANKGFRVVEGCPYIVCLADKVVTILHLEVRRFISFTAGGGARAQRATLPLGVALLCRLMCTRQRADG